MIDRVTIDKIMDATNIVDVVSEFVTLKKTGVNYKGLCPFHDDKTPSFIVSPAKGICHCFACGKGGNAVNFLMEHEQMTYPDALRWLAKKYNILVVPGASFACPGYVRIAYCVGSDTIRGSLPGFEKLAKELGL